jgi:hypothetical protein
MSRANEVINQQIFTSVFCMAECVEEEYSVVLHAIEQESTYFSNALFTAHHTSLFLMLN